MQKKKLLKKKELEEINNILSKLENITVTPLMMKKIFIRCLFLQSYLESAAYHFLNCKEAQVFLEKNKCLSKLHPSFFDKLRQELEEEIQLLLACSQRRKVKQP